MADAFVTLKPCAPFYLRNTGFLPMSNIGYTGLLAFLVKLFGGNRMVWAIVKAFSIIVVLLICMILIIAESSRRYYKKQDQSPTGNGESPGHL